MARGLRGGIIIGIFATGVVGMIFGVVPPPKGIVDFTFDTSTVGGGVLAVPQVLQLSLLPVIFALFMTDFFDTMGTMFAVAQEGKLLDEEGGVPQAKRILLVDSLAAILGGSHGRELGNQLHRERVWGRRGRKDGHDERGRRAPISARPAVLAPDLGLRRLDPDSGPGGRQAILCSSRP